MTAIDVYFDEQIKSFEKKRQLFAAGFEAAQAAGFDLNTSACLGVLSRAYDAASMAHAREMGDGPYKPVDYEFNYPSSTEAYGRYVVEECKNQRINKLPPKLDMQQQLTTLDANYDGDGSLKDAFELVTRVSTHADDPTLDALFAFQNILSVQKDHEVRSLADFVGQVIKAKRAFAPT